METMEFTICGVNGIGEPRTVRLERGKVNKLEGPNGAGKTSAMRALARYLGDDKAPVELHDGEEAGYIQGPGGRMAVTERVKALRSPGYEVADRGGALVRLISGAGLKGEKERTNAYIKALAELVDVPADDAAIDSLCFGDHELAAWLKRQLDAGGITDLFTAGAVLKPEIDERALTKEKAALSHDGAVEAALVAIQGATGKLQGLGAKPLPDDVPCNTQAAQNAVAAAGAALADVRARRGGKEQKLEMQARVAAGLGPEPETEREILAEGLALVEAREAQVEVERLERLLFAARERVTDVSAGLKVARAAVTAATSRLQLWLDQRAIVDETIEGPTDADVDAAWQALEAAKVEDDRVRATADLRLAMGARQRAKASQEALALEAKKLRAMAHGQAERLGEILGNRGLKDITVKNGRLHWRSPDGELHDWDTRMSSGQRIRAAFALAAGQFHGVVFLPATEQNAFWLLLDPQNQAEVERIAAEMNLYVVTEVPAGGGSSGFPRKDKGDGRLLG